MQALLALSGVPTPGAALGATLLQHHFSKYGGHHLIEQCTRHKNLSYTGYQYVHGGGRLGPTAYLMFIARQLNMKAQCIFCPINCLK